MKLKANGYIRSNLMIDMPNSLWTQALKSNEVSTACFIAHSTSPEPPDDCFKEYIRADIHEAKIKELQEKLAGAIITINKMDDLYWELYTDKQDGKNHPYQLIQWEGQIKELESLLEEL